MKSPQGTGTLAVLGACCIWGLSPLYYKLLSDVPAVDILAHRTIWSLALFGAILAAQGRLGQIGAALASGPGALVVASAMISVNWLVFILAVQTGYVVDSSLGYYIFPLVAVAIGRLAFGERPGPLQWAAVALATTGVSVLTWGLGSAPWISLILALSFALYGAIKRNVRAGPVVSVTAEVLILSPFALIWIVGQGGAGIEQGGAQALLLLASGPMTALPLVLFSFAAQRLDFASLGIFQYLNPTLQFLCGAVIFGEVFTRWHAIAFPLIWGAVTLYSLALWAQSRRSRKAARAASASGTT